MTTDKKSIDRLSNLKGRPFESYYIADINFLKKQGIINWVGAEWQGEYIRYLMTKIFHFLDFARHDINFWKGWTLKDFNHANWGLLKYSFLSLADEYRKLHNSYKWSKIWRHPYFIMTAIIKVVLIMYAFSICDSKLWRGAFNFHND